MRGAQTPPPTRNALLSPWTVCVGYLRTQENFMLSIPEDRAAVCCTLVIRLIGPSNHYLGRLDCWVNNSA